MLNDSPVLATTKNCLRRLATYVGSPTSRTVLDRTIRSPGGTVHASHHPGPGSGPKKDIVTESATFDTKEHRKLSS